MALRPKAASTSGPGSMSMNAGSGISSTATCRRVRRPVRRLQPGDRRADRTRDARLAPPDIDAAVAAARKAQAQMGRALGLRTDVEASLCARAPCAEAGALFLGPGDDRQRQADPRVARYRHPARRPAFISSCGLGLADRPRVPGTRPVGVCGQIIPWNFPLLMPPEGPPRSRPATRWF